MTLIWGPRAWLLIHYLTYNCNSSPSQLKKFEIFFNNFEVFIPCPMCVDFYLKEKKLIKIDFKNKDDLIKWGLDIHNYVNKRLHKQEYSLEKSTELYSKITLNPLYLRPYLEILANMGLYNIFKYNKEKNQKKEKSLDFLKKYINEFKLLSELFRFRIKKVKII